MLENTDNTDNSVLGYDALITLSLKRSFLVRLTQPTTGFILYIQEKSQWLVKTAQTLNAIKKKK